MFRRVLIANRGEIACRIIQTCRRLGIESVAVHSEAEMDALHVRLADVAVCVGPPAVAQSYLNVESIIDAALRTGAEAVHPGYGLLSERADAARAIADAGLVFVGPSPAAIELMGNKTAARARMAAAGVPVVPGTGAAVKQDDDAAALASAIGYPLMVKASAGGGGIGMTVVRGAASLSGAVERARRSAARAFASDAIYFERYIAQARHIEVQVLGDAHGQLIHLGDRECSVQRRHQKVVEEAPAPNLPDDRREQLLTTALRAAAAVGYTNAGTVEFLLGPDREFYFLEMNTRLQVEHRVTEAVTGLDLVELQLRVAAGEPLPLRQEDVHPSGHALECRLYAEDPQTQLPSPGTITVWEMPDRPDVLVDCGATVGTAVTPLYDPLLAKIVVRGADRDSALAQMRAVLAGVAVEGVKTNLPLLRRILDAPPFVAGSYGTDLLPSLVAEAGAPA